MFLIFGFPTCFLPLCCQCLNAEKLTCLFHEKMTESVELALWSKLGIAHTVNLPHLKREHKLHLPQ